MERHRSGPDDDDDDDIDDDFVRVAVAVDNIGIGMGQGRLQESRGKFVSGATRREEVAAGAIACSTRRFHGAPTTLTPTAWMLARVVESIDAKHSHARSCRMVNGFCSVRKWIGWNEHVEVGREKCSRVLIKISFSFRTGQSSRLAGQERNANQIVEQAGREK